MIALEHKENDQSPAGIRLPKGRVNILAWAMSFFDIAKPGLVLEHFANFLYLYTVLVRQLLHDVFQPDKARDFHGNAPTRF